MVQQYRSLRTATIILLLMVFFTPVVQPVDAALPDFSYISLAPIANLPMGHLVSPPSGEVTLGGIPFNLLRGNQAEFGTTCRYSPPRPTEATIGGLQISDVRAVHVLIVGGWVLESLRGQKVGELGFAFSDGSRYTFDLQAGVHIREAWHYENPELNNPYNIIYEIQASQEPWGSWQNVWQESQYRDGKPALAFLDKLTIKIPGEFRGRTLTSVNIRDTSDPDPCIHIDGITAETGEEAPSWFDPGDDRVDPRPGDRVAVYCDIPESTLTVYGINDVGQGFFLDRFSYSDIVASGPSGVTHHLGENGSVSVSVDGQNNFWLAWNGGKFNATGQGDFAKGFNCAFTL
jgi:hypothetical protein